MTKTLRKCHKTTNQHRKKTKHDTCHGCTCHTAVWPCEVVILAAFKSRDVVFCPIQYFYLKFWKLYDNNFRTHLNDIESYVAFFNGTQCSIGQDYIILMDVYQPTNSIHTMQLDYHYTFKVT